MSHYLMGKWGRNSEAGTWKVGEEIREVKEASQETTPVACTGKVIAGTFLKLRAVKDCTDNLRYCAVLAGSLKPAVFDVSQDRWGDRNCISGPSGGKM